MTTLLHFVVTLATICGAIVFACLAVAAFNYVLLAGWYVLISPVLLGAWLVRRLQHH
jgi:hypothetical protein